MGTRIYDVGFGGGVGGQMRMNTLGWGAGIMEEEMVHPQPSQVSAPEVVAHAPWPGLRNTCENCGTAKVRRLGSESHSCESCGYKKRKTIPNPLGKDKVIQDGDMEVPVTSTREIALEGRYVSELWWVGVTMLSAALLHLILLLVIWEGFDWFLVQTASPWLLSYVPVPIALLNGTWAISCSRHKHVSQSGSGFCMRCTGLCGTAWGCDGPSCGFNMGLDLGLGLSGLVAALPPAISGFECENDCYIFCLPCPPEDMATTLVLLFFAAMIMAATAVCKTTIMWKALRQELGGISFRNW
ncbi:unnamed protein product [Discosporangium mesarthrocarpum]